MQYSRTSLMTIGAIVLATLIAPLLLPGFITFQLTQIIGFALALVGLNVLAGWAGQPCLGHGAFFAIGAYITAVLTQHAVPWWIALPAASILGSGIAFVLGKPILRLERTYLALATFALALAVPQLLHFSAFEQWVGGATGLQITRPSPPAWMSSFATEDAGMYWIALFTALSATIGVEVMLRGRLGLELRAIRDHSIAASACGIDVTRAKMLAFSLSAALACLGGGLYALSVQLVTPDSFTLFLSLTMLVALTIGGAGTTAGPWIGAVFVQVVPTLAEKVSTAAPWAIFGCAVLLVVFLEPRGLLVLVRRLARRAASR
jgi:branched-chain amino acid transport system permease protein